MRALKILLLVVSAMLPAAANAQRSPVLVELYTSQGCSSCPPADAILSDLAALPDVVALALHVDYWDYLGWKDSFGRAAHSKRQHAYAKAVRERSVYTPQMIVQGMDRVAGADRERVTALIAQHQARPSLVSLGLARDGDVLEIRLSPTSATGVGPTEVFLVRFIPDETVSIEHGENAGHTISYVNVVTEWSLLGAWDGRTPIDFAAELPGPQSVAVIVQRDRMGPVLSAAMLR